MERIKNGCIKDISNLTVEGQMGPNISSSRIDIVPNGQIQTKGGQKILNNAQQLSENGIIPSLSVGQNMLSIDSNRGALRYLEFYFPDGRSQYLRFRSGIRSSSSIERTKIISGPCLMSVSGATVTHKNGERTPLTMPGIEINKPVVDLEVQDTLSYYEVESIGRIAQTIGTIGAYSDLPTQLGVNIPKVEYYLYAMDAFSKGYLTRPQVEQWMDAVDKRSERMRALFTSRVNKAARGSIQIMNANQLDSLDSYVRDSVASDRLPCLEEMTQRLADSSCIARSMLQADTPKDYNSLNCFGYVYEVVSAAAEKGTFALSIENPTDEQIFVQAEHFSKQLASQGYEPDLGAMYALPKIVYAENGQGLYFAPGSPSLSETKSILRAYQ